ncbi:phytanoyl-CoA dioxygenase family protein [Paraburkholderia sp. NPDC080076]|uniref:phytanoyl-CoA dioxygenase family protein n=1 Tax=Paraburkholderia sp. NPDC080076 TaxID=3390605 RepID=UPI003D0192D6
MLSQDQIDSFRKKGYCVIENAMSEQELEGAREAADALVEAAVKGRPYPPSFLREGQAYSAISKGNRHFFSNRCEIFPALDRFVKGQMMAELASDLLGPKVYLFNEQIVVKAPQHGDSFAWHQDSGYVPFAHRPYLTVWCALDRSTRDNGTLFVIPRDISQDLSVTKHEWDSNGANLVGFRGDEEGEVIEVPAGAAVAFSSVMMHRTGANRTAHPRRALVCQYTAEPLLRPETGRPHNRAVPMPCAAGTVDA